MEIPWGWGSRAKVPSLGGGGGEYGYFLELHNPETNTILDYLIWGDCSESERYFFLFLVGNVGRVIYLHHEVTTVTLNVFIRAKW